jgi:hypothetical protein
MTALRSWLLDTLLTRQTWALEAFLAAQAVAWGVWVAWPLDDVFPYNGQVDPYSLLVLLPEWLVGGVFLAHGLGHLLALHRGNVKWCRRGALAVAALWTFVLTSFALARWLFDVPLVPATPIYASSIAAALWIYARLNLKYAA